MDRILVKAKEGARCPMEGKPGRHITDIPVKVPATSYYKRLLRDGSLVAVEDEPEKAVAAQKRSATKPSAATMKTDSKAKDKEGDSR